MIRIKIVHFKVPGTPKGKARARTVTKNGKTWSYTPKGTIEFENSIKNGFLEVEKSGGIKEYAGSIKVLVVAYFKPSKSLLKKSGDLFDEPYLKKPDGDNIAKAVCDALNGVAYKDDNCIYDIEVKKFYGDTDCMFITIWYEEEK